MSTLGQPNQDWVGDHGDPDPALRALLAEAASSPRSYLQAVAALCSARFLLPIVAHGDEHASSDGPDPNRHAEMAALTLQTPDGRRALPVFTGLDAMRAWQPQARPVPCRLDEVASTAAEQGADTVLIDVAGPHQLVLEGQMLAEFVAGRRLVRLPDGGWGWLYATDSPSSAPNG